MEQEPERAYRGSERIEEEAKRLQLLATIANEEAGRVLGHLQETGFAPKHIVDMGCGTGDAFPLFRTLFPGSQLSGLDQSANAALLAQERYDVRVRTANLMDAAAYEGLGPIDLAYFRNVLVHVPNPRAVLEHARGMLSADGILMAQEPDWTDADANWENFAAFKRAFTAMMQKLGMDPFMGTKLPGLFEQLALRDIATDRSSRRVEHGDNAWDILPAMVEVGSRWLEPFLQAEGIPSVAELRERIAAARGNPANWFTTPSWVIVWGKKG